MATIKEPEENEVLAGYRLEEQMEIFRIKCETEEKEAMLQKVDLQEDEDSLDHVVGLDDEGILWQLETTLRELRFACPDERNERSRRYTITITEMEKIVAYFKMFVINR